MADKNHFHAATDPDLFHLSLDGLPRRTTLQGYVNIRVLPGLWEAEHRMVLAQALGRPLAKGETAHHRNGDRADNRAENLELWVGGHRNGQRASEMLRCPSCGTCLRLTEA